MAGRWYDEVFDLAGARRAPYAAAQRRLGWDPLRPRPAMAERLWDRPFGDDTRILPVPLVLDDAEYRTFVQAGLRQRALALQRFFADLVGAGARLAAAGLTPQVLDAILATELTTLDALRTRWGSRDRDAIRFVYAPDLVRGPDGGVIVLEDNLGCVGGVADSFFVDDHYRAAAGLPRRAAQDADVAVAVTRCLERDGLGRHDVLATPGCDVGVDGLHDLRVVESERQRALLDELGIRVGLPNEGDPVVTCQHVLNLDADTSTHDAIGLLNAPGTALLGNKALLPFSSELIRAYCCEEPVLRTQPTRILDGGLGPDPGDVVVKTSTGRGGGEVFVLRSCSARRLAVIDRHVREVWPRAGAVAQARVEHSRLTPSGPQGWDGYLVELRPVTYVIGWNEVLVSEVPLGRAVSAYDARRLCNVSQGSCYLPVLREAAAA